MNNLIKSKQSNFKIIATYYIVILLLLIYGIYKNGFLLYHKGLVSFLYLFKPIILILGSVLLSYFIKYLFLKYKDRDLNIKYKLLNCYDGVFISLIVLCLPININLLNYFSILVLFLLLINLFKVKSINYYCLFKLIIVVSMLILNYYNYQNIYETNVETALTTLDLFMGRSIGGIGTTSSFWIIIGYLIMLTIPAFKKDIPVTCIITYFIMMLFGLFFSHNIINDVKMLFTSETLFGFVFISTIPMFSPIEKNNKKIYAITIGILTYLLNYLVNPYEGVFISILLTNLFCAIKDKLGIDFFNKKIYN